MPSSNTDFSIEMKKYYVYVVLILLLALLARRFRLENNMMIVGDTARDVEVTREVLKHHTVPLFASFSSAGPFVFAPEYYWLLPLVYFFNPNNLFFFFDFLTLQSLVFVALLMIVGRRIAGRRFTLLAGLIAAVSPRQIYRAQIMTQHTIVALCAMAAVYFFVRYVKEKKGHQIFWCGLWVSLAISMHYQALGLLIFGLPILLGRIPWRKKIIHAAVYGAGVFLPLLPLFIWDYSQKFANINNFLDYMLIGQYRIYVPNRWLTHVFNFWPQTAGDIFSGSAILGGIMLYGALFLLLLAWWRKKISLAMKYFFVFFIFYYVYFRFYRGEKFEGYLMYLHPLFFLILTTFIYQLTRFKKIGWLLVTPILFLNFFSMKEHYQKMPAKSQTQVFDEVYAKIIDEVGDDKKFSVYGLNAGYAGAWTDSFNQAEFFASYLDAKNKIDERGTKVTFCNNTCPSGTPVIVRAYEYKVMVFPPEAVISANRLNPHDVYLDVLFWWEKRPLKSTFNLQKYIYERTLCRNCHI